MTQSVKEISVAQLWQYKPFSVLGGRAEYILKGKKNFLLCVTYTSP